MEKIISISEVNVVLRKPDVRYDSTYTGYEVVTDKQRIRVLIDDCQSCCENYGYIASEDNFDDFIGAELISINATDTALKTYKVRGFGLDVDACQFVTLTTSKGVLQFVVYNEHNGYYGHDTFIQSEQTGKVEGRL